MSGNCGARPPFRYAEARRRQRVVGEMVDRFGASLLRGRCAINQSHIQGDDL